MEAMDYDKLVEVVKAHGGLDDEELVDAGNHGADAGWSGFTYTSDGADFYAANKALVWELLSETADAMGYDNPMALVATFNRIDMAESDGGFECLLAWFALEEAGRYLADKADA